MSLLLSKVLFPSFPTGFLFSVLLSQSLVHPPDWIITCVWSRHPRPVFCIPPPFPTYPIPPSPYHHILSHMFNACYAILRVFFDRAGEPFVFPSIRCRSSHGRPNGQSRWLMIMDPRKSSITVLTCFPQHQDAQTHRAPAPVTMFRQSSRITVTHHTARIAPASRPFRLRPWPLPSPSSAPVSSLH